MGATLIKGLSKKTVSDIYVMPRRWDTNKDLVSDIVVV